MKIKINKRKIVSLIEYLICISMILELNSIWLDKKYFLGKINTLLLCMCLIIISIINKDKLLEKRVFIHTFTLILILTIFNTIFILINNNNYISYIARFIILFILYILEIQSNKENNLLLKISDIMLIIASISLFIYIFGTTLSIIKPTSTILLNWGGEHYIDSYFGLHYNAQKIYLNGKIYFRNTSIFTEAPMYSFNLCIALIVELFIKKNVYINRVIIIILTIFSTLSTTGMVLACILLSIKYISYKSKLKFYHIVKIIIGPFIIGISLYIIYFFINDKINSSSNGIGSFSVRMEDFRIAFEIWKEKFIFGHGFEMNSMILERMSSDRGDDIGGSNSLLFILSHGGLYLLLMHILPFLLYIKKGISSMDKSKIIISFSIFVLVLFTKVEYTYLVIYILARGWVIGTTKDINRTQLKDVNYI